MSSPLPRLAVLVALSPLALFAAPPQHFTVTATFVPAPKAGGESAVAVTFVPLDPDVRINEEPAARLKLDPGQTLLVDKQRPPQGAVKNYDPDTATYLDLSRPVSFPVAHAKGAPKGPHTLVASVTYFYCSKREGWCRKGTTEVEFVVP